MKKTLILLFGITLLYSLSTSCESGKAKVCRIHGVMEDNSRDGSKIFLVPLIKPTNDNVDSVEIRNGRFEFTTDKLMMAIIRVELKHRYGIQDLLIETEPGDLNVKIGLQSSSNGTPHNDLLQEWKTRTEEFHKERQQAGNSINFLMQSGDSILADKVKRQADSLAIVYRNYTNELKKTVGEGPLYDFFVDRQ